MNEQSRRRLVRYAAATIAGGGMAVLVMVLQGFLQAEDIAVKYRILTDAFTVPGALLVLVGIMVWVAGEGLFYGLSYSLGWAFKGLIPGGRTGERERYYDYVERKKAKGKPRGYAFLFLTGAAFLAVGTVFMVLFYSVY